ncbi:TetR/AcrR family transcriptional regulator [Amycolatopsis sp. EV170708-02-1]|uniref:TetR/AcrR family transcriptional regulator n=1 Tax=Amycolatopsis sp. EV170708-02-1 TaxID=2919322 RepID=UPI001F0C5129|nr:TetR/AcrR family transcriptional regulator [Amycolatopsis sp. EV170708-02-1]UMP01307.1 TetR/AcrR family transcriptional regulator [Amycolatopsis sp. EV170708-02-1]
MSTRATRKVSRQAAQLPPIKPEHIIEAAVKLTRAHGLDGWTIRQLAAALEVWPRVIDYHVGDREAVMHGVLEHVVAQIPVPSTETPWQDWFRRSLHDARPILRRHRGTARRIVVLGPVVSTVASSLDAGVGALLRAGFAHHALDTYRYLANTAFMLVSVEDERDDFPDARARNNQFLASYRDDRDRPGLATAALIASERQSDRAAIERQEEDFYTLTIERCIAGAEAHLRELIGAR